MKDIILVEKLSGMYHWIEKQLESLNEAKKLEKNLVHKAMLNGKAKSLIDVLSYMKQKQGKFIYPIKENGQLDFTKNK